MKLLIPFLFFSFLTGFSQINPRQANTTGSEVFADAPYQMKMYNDSGSLNPIPIHVFVHQSSGFGSNNQLMDITIKIKNSLDSSFIQTINFDDYTDSAFQTLFINESPDDAELDIQPFSESGAIKDPVFTINFTSHSNAIPYTTFVNITQDYWWFTILIPPDKIDGLNPIIDFEVFMGLDWASDYTCYLRVFRQEEDVPSITNWSRGDLHYHGLYTQNDAEVGLPIDATKLIAKICGLDWISLTDHSCDLDNYGIGSHENWQHLENSIIQLNASDSTFIFLRGMEMSINNSEGKIVHSLAYPAPEDPFGLAYIGDGGGDLFSTAVSINQLSDSLTKYGAFTYAAHPFSEGDVLSALVNGSVWNISHPEFPENVQPHPSIGTVICNNLLFSSDIFSEEANKLIKDNIIGGEIWNLCNLLRTNDDAENPWDVFHTNSGFSYWPESDILHPDYRFYQNMDVTEFIWRKGLSSKNTNTDIENWKFFISAGSDAHGSFNYSTTDFSFGVYGYVTENVIGKFSTLTFCPNGMGANGQNVLHALKNGNAILSSGPIAGFEIETDTTNSFPEIIIGNDVELSFVYFQNSIIRVFAANSAEYGEIFSKQMKVITETETFFYDFPNDTAILEACLEDIFEEIFDGNIPIDEYFLMMLEMHSLKEYDNTEIYKRESEVFKSFTNPVWIKIDFPVGTDKVNEKLDVKLFPNPTSDFININFTGTNRAKLILSDSKGMVLLTKEIEQNTRLSIKDFSSGLYFIKIITDTNFTVKKIVIQ